MRGDERRPLGLSRDRPAPREDTCPACGGRRRELVIVPGRFYCEACNATGDGPTDGPAPPATTADAPTLFDV